MKRKIIVFILALCTLCVPVFAQNHNGCHIEQNGYKYYIHLDKENAKKEDFYSCILFNEYKIEKGKLFFNGYREIFVFREPKEQNGEIFYYGGGGSAQGWYDRIDLDAEKSIRNKLYIYSSNCSVLTTDIQNYLGNYAIKDDNYEGDFPPQLAPIVGADLKTEYVLSAILPLVGIILAFLVVYWSFYKGYGILLKVLGKR